MIDYEIDLYRDLDKVMGYELVMDYVEYLNEDESIEEINLFMKSPFVPVDKVQITECVGITIIIDGLIQY